MEEQTVNWGNLFLQLHTDTFKTSGKWMLITLFIASLIIVAFFLLLFRKQPVAVIFMTAGVLMFSSRYVIGLWRLSENPKVYSGVITGKTENSFTEESTAVSYVTHKLRLIVVSRSELTENGLDNTKQLEQRKLVVNCSEKIFMEVTEGEKLIIVVTPHDKFIAWYMKEQSTL